MSRLEPSPKTPSASDAIVSELMMLHQVNNLGRQEEV
jgi:hypothetical protein